MIMISMENTINPKSKAKTINIINATERLGRAGDIYAWPYSSKPQHIKADDGNSYVVKFKGNPQGTRILANEYVAGSLSKLIGIPTPTFSIMNVDTKLLEYINRINGTEFYQGSQFASTYIISNNMTEGIKNAVNAKDWPKVIVFEALIQNTDFREMHVLLYTDKKDKQKRFCVVDHGFAFNEKKWTELEPKRVWNLPSSAFVNITRQMKADGISDKSIDNTIIEKFKLKDNEIKAIVDSPFLEEWGIDKDDKDAIATYLSHFSENAKKVAELLRK
jgi:hypothetical protein